MKVFLSYGHNDHVKLVDAVFDALVEAGHTPWKDDRYEGVSGIAPGEDFVKVIYDAIDDSDFVVAFVTASTIEKRFCCDERQYAYNKKGTKFIQIRLDGAEIRLGNSLSYIDMGDVEENNGEINQVMFKEKMNSLFYAFRDPASFAEGGFTPWAKFDAHLKVDGVMKYREFLAMPEKDDFVGREWLCEKCKNWVVDDSIACRLFVILGEAGSGKTAFVRHLAADRTLVKSVHVCIYDRPSTRTARDTLKDLAYVLAENNERYFNFLKNKELDKLANMNTDGLFEFLFIEPLKNETEKYLLVIDGLDELDEENGLMQLFKVFRQYATRINPNISFLLTGRPDENILYMLKTVNGYNPEEQVMLDMSANEKDLLRYIEMKLNELGCYSPALVQALLEACDGNFEYLSLTFKEAQEEGLRLSEKIAMPKGLYRRYTQYIDRKMETKGQALRFTIEQYRLLSVICAAYEPMSVSLLAELVDMDEYRVETELAFFGSLIRKNETEDGELYVSLFTKSFKDYLVEKAFRNYSVDIKSGIKTVAEYILEKCKSVKSFSKYAYIKENGFRHLLEYANHNEDNSVAEFIVQLWQEDADLVVNQIAVALDKGDVEVSESFFKLIEGNDLLQDDVIGRVANMRWLETLEKIARALENIGKHEMSFIVKIDIASAIWRAPVGDVEKICEEAREFCRRKYEENPCYETRKYFIIADRKFVNAVYRGEGTKNIKRYKNIFELSKKNYEEKPCYESRKNLAQICLILGDVVATGVIKYNEINKPEEFYEMACELYTENHIERNCSSSRSCLADIYFCRSAFNYNVYIRCSFIKHLKIAEEYLEKAIELLEENYKNNPSKKDRNNLGSGYHRLYQISICRNEMDKVKELSEKACRIYELNYTDAPDDVTAQNLVSEYMVLGYMAKLKNTPQDLLEAKGWFEKAYLLFLEDNDSLANKRDEYAANLREFGVEAMTENTAEGLFEAVQWFKKAYAMYEKNNDKEKCCECRCDLANAFWGLGGIAEEKGTLADLREAKQWYRKAVELFELCYQEFPDGAYYDEFLATACYLIGVLEMSGTPEELAEAKVLQKKVDNL